LPVIRHERAGVIGGERYGFAKPRRRALAGLWHLNRGGCGYSDEPLRVSVVFWRWAMTAWRSSLRIRLERWMLCALQAAALRGFMALRC
jgi:hypothetical protein